MKKLLFLLVMILLPILASADSVEIDGIYYNLVTTGKVAEVMINPNRYSGSVIIPEKVKYDGTEYSVTSIGSGAFYRCTGLTSITIGFNVTSIGKDAFTGCTGLTSISIPNSVTSIGLEAFRDCTGLTAVYILDLESWRKIKMWNIYSNPLYYAHHLFLNGDEIKDLVIPNGVTSIEGAFLGCSGLTSITIPNSVTNIGYHAFRGCTGLTSINIPNSVTSIGNYAFYECSSLTSVTIGSGIKTIGSEAFASCPELVDVYCLAENVPDTYRDVFNNSNTENATLHVPTNSINNYKSKYPWSTFRIIMGLDGTMPETHKCEKPMISYQNGQLKFYSNTDGVIFVSDITDNDIKKSYDALINLTATYYISVYATKSGYENSDVATATLCWIDVDPKTEGISNGVANVRAMPVMIQNDGNVLNISGAPEGSMINVYDLSGQMVGSAKAGFETISISTSLRSGEIGIVKIGDKSVKVFIK